MNQLNDKAGPDVCSSPKRFSRSPQIHDATSRWPSRQMVNAVTALSQGRHLGCSLPSARCPSPISRLRRAKNEAKLRGCPFNSDAKSRNRRRPFLVEVHLSLFGFKISANVPYASFTRRRHPAQGPSRGRGGNGTVSCSEEQLVLTSPGHCPSLEALQTTANRIRPRT